MLTIGVIISLLSAASWALGTITFEKLGSAMPAAGMTFFKSLFSIILMSILMSFFGWTLPSWHNMLLLSISGIVGISIGDTLFFDSLQCLGAKTQVLFFILGQVVTILLSFLVLGEVLSLGQYLGALCIIVGVMTVMIGKQDSLPNKMRGIIEGLAAMLCYSVSIIITKTVVEDVSAVTVTFYRMLFGSVFILISGAIGGKLREWGKPLSSTRYAAAFGLNTLIVCYGGFLLSIVALKFIDVTIASVVSTTEPLFVLLLSFIIKHDKPTPRELLGASIATAGVLFIITLN